MAFKLKKTWCILDDGTNQYETKNEYEMLQYIEKVKQILIDNKKNNMIFCLERLAKTKINNKKYKVYLLINDEYNDKEQVLQAIRKYRKNGFRAYPIL